MENKYYTPDIEDFYIGYECELLYEDWEKSIYSTTHVDFFNIEHLIKLNRVRTSFLTKEQIEAEGWTFVKERDAFKKNDGLYKCYMNYFSNSNGSSMTIHDGHGSTYYDGECKSVNEFRRIEKWLGIK